MATQPSLVAPQLSFNTTLLGKLYLPLEPPGGSSTGWNDGNGAYFISQGSEYEILQPATVSYTAHLTDAQITNIKAAIGSLNTALNKIANSSNQAEITQLTDELSDWVNALSAGETVNMMTVTTLITHVRNNQVDDQAPMTVTYAWIPAVGAALPVTVDLCINWAGTTGGASLVIDWIRNASLMFRLDETFIAEVTLASISVAAVFMAVSAMVLATLVGATKLLINLANDGGRVNFVAVIAHAINRITACIQPAPEVPSNLQLPTIDLNGLGYTWITTEKGSNVIPGENFTFQNAMVAGVYPAGVGGPYEQESGNVLINDFDTDALYTVGAPELSWSLNGAGTVLTSKIEVDENGETVYAIALMIFNHAGQLACVSAFMEDGASANISVPSPMAYPPSYLVPEGPYGIYPLGNVIGGEFIGSDIAEPSSLQLAWVIPEVMVAFQNNLKMVSPPSGDWTDMPQPSLGYAINWGLGGVSYDTGRHPTIAVDSNNQVLTFHEGGSNDIYSILGYFYGNSIGWATDGVKRGGGDWPSVSFISGSDFLEVHSSGSGQSDLYWERGNLGTDNHGGAVVDWDENGGTQINNASGYYTSMAINASGLVVVMFTQGNSSLQFSIGDLAGTGTSTSMAWEKPSSYTSGDYPSVVLTNNGCVLEVHSYRGDLYYNIGTAYFYGITWNSTEPLPLNVEGDTTGLALRSDGMVCLVYSSNQSNDLYYGMGVLDANNKKINWITLNNKYTTGAFPAVAFAPSGQVAETHQGSSSSDSLWWSIGNIITP